MLMNKRVRYASKTVYIKVITDISSQGGEGRRGDCLLKVIRRLDRRTSGVVEGLES